MTLTPNNPGQPEQTGGAAKERDQDGADLLGDDSIWTPEIERLGEAIRTHLRLGFRGMAVDGQQRCGKTSACEFLQRTLSDTIGYPIATFLWSIPEFASTERDFVQERLRDSGCHATGHRDSAVLRGRLYDHLTEAAAAKGTRKVIIIVDEAHYLTRQQYHYLHHADNNLRLRKVRPFFVLVGQPELRDMPSSWMQSNGFQVVGRFFARQHTYKGIALADLPTILEGFDEPAGDATEATYASAVPEAYAAGWRLGHVSKALVETIAAIAAKHNILSGIRVPMENLRAMLLAILYQVIEDKVDPRRLTRKMLAKAVRESGFPAVMNYYVDREQADDDDDAEAA
jgi:hypothetical protein